MYTILSLLVTFRTMKFIKILVNYLFFCEFVPFTVEF